jgi:hypothetical protein
MSVWMHAVGRFTSHSRNASLSIGTPARHFTTQSHAPLEGEDDAAAGKLEQAVREVAIARRRHVTPADGISRCPVTCMGPRRSPLETSY